MILSIGDGYEIETSFTNEGIRWAQLWAPKTILRKAGLILYRGGEAAINECLDEFREIMGLAEDESNEWQRRENNGSISKSNTK